MEAKSVGAEYGACAARSGRTDVGQCFRTGQEYGAYRDKAERSSLRYDESGRYGGRGSGGQYKPSSDLPTHLFLYRTYPTLGGIVHTHSACATAFAQSGRGIPAYGTTHADAFFGEVPCTRSLTDEEIDEAYEKNTGKVIAETIADAEAIPAVLVKNHGVFTWGRTPEKAVEAAVTVEEVARMALFTELLGGKNTVDQHLLDKHYFRKHGENAYYGQK